MVPITCIMTHRLQNVYIAGDDRSKKQLPVWNVSWTIVYFECEKALISKTRESPETKSITHCWMLHGPEQDDWRRLRRLAYFESPESTSISPPASQIVALQPYGKKRRGIWAARRHGSCVSDHGLDHTSTCDFQSHKWYKGSYQNTSLSQFWRREEGQ